MDTPIAARITELINTLGLNKKSFAEAIGVSQPIITHITNGRNNPGLDVIQKILLTFSQVNPDWLILGRGDLLRSKSKNDTESFKKILAETEQKILSANYELHNAVKLVQAATEQLKTNS